MKSKSIFVCSECGNESSKWLGKCPACNAWNSFYEEKIDKYTNSKSDLKRIEPINLNEVEIENRLRISTGFDELDRVLGGGLVKGSLVLIRWRARNRQINFNITNM